MNKSFHIIVRLGLALDHAYDQSSDQIILPVVDSMSRYMDYSASENTRLKKGRAAAASTVTKSVDNDTLLTIREGRSTIRIQPAGGGPAYDVAGCCPSTCAGQTLTVTTDNINGSAFTPFQPPFNPIYDISYNFAWDISWNAITGTSSYNVTVAPPDPYKVVSTGSTSAQVYIQAGAFYDITVSAIGACPTSGVLSVVPCFLAGSLVQMADGSVKAIEDVVVGDLLIGAFGETNPVLALHRPLLGSSRMTRINDEHSTSDHHPHISVDRGFYCAVPTTLGSTYGHEHEVIDESGHVVKRMLHGLKKGRVQQLEVGVVLKTVEGGRPVMSVEMYDLHPETQLYNLVMGGSHTYHVDGYAVTGWPREDDWDYDTWTPRVV